jgi:putative heme-binding domain-containing protein
VAEVFGSPQARLTLGLAEHGKALPDLIGNRKLSAELRVDAVRLLQLSLGDIGAPSAQGTVWEGYTCRRAGNPIDKATKSSLRQAFPSGHAVLDRELTRTLAMIEDDNDELARSVASRLTANSDPQADVHYLIVLSRLRAGITPEMVDRVAEALLCLDEKITQRKMVRESNWSARLGEMMPQLVRRYPNLNDILVQHPQFGRPDHALFAHTPGFNRAKAAERFWELSQQGDFVWDARLIGILAELPAEKGAQALRKLWGQVGQDEVILPLLARMPKPEDRERLLQGLNSGRLSVVQAAAEGLLKLPLHKERDELLAMVLALGRLPSGKEGDPVRKPLLELLQGNTGEKASDTDSWARWLAMTWPAIAPRLRNRDGVDVEAWEKRLKQVDWDKGEAERGLVVFRKASCAACHGGGQSIGPDLVGVGKRFSRTDLLTAILQPSKDVSPRYRTTLLTTSAGKTYQGLIVYEATDSVILQAGPSTTIRLTNAQITERHLTAQSLMPAGLLDRMSDGEIADLYVYLKSLR